MHKRLLYLLAYLFLSAHPIFATDTLKLIRRIPIQASLMTTDPGGHVYAVRTDNAVIKFNMNGDSLGFFNEIKKGKITQIDATNPLRVLIFNSSFSRISILDNLLSLKSSLNLSSMGLYNIPCIANSADGYIWVYDPSTGALLKIDEKPSVRMSVPLRNFFTKAPDPCYMVEQDRQLFMVDSLEGVHKFDLYGFFNLTYPIKTTSIQYIQDQLIYSSLPDMVSYHTKSTQEKRLVLPKVESILQVRVERERLFVLRETSLDIYQLPGE
ncbi:MAG: hypothetical protein JNJ58_07020 [Chitinophagaceae bacterium]|nr:hypothetical protein [Chitinophagaceae bacterium]